jgi:hypothetical protein
MPNKFSTAFPATNLYLRFKNAATQLLGTPCVQNISRLNRCIFLGSDPKFYLRFKNTTTQLLSTPRVKNISRLNRRIFLGSDPIEILIEPLLLHRHTSWGQTPTLIFGLRTRFTTLRYTPYVDK